MTSSQTNQYIRQVLHQSEPPPPIKARFFYTSPIPIDDPLSPLPPTTSSSTWSKQPPKPFSGYDNVALDKAWHELRQKIWKYNEERGEKSNEGSRSRAGSDIRNVRRGSSSRPATPRTKPTRPAASSLSQVDGPPDIAAPLDGLGGASIGSEVLTSPDTTATPFARLPSRTKVKTLQREERPTRPTVQTHDTYQWDDVTHLAQHSPAPEVGKDTTKPEAKVPVGVSRLHEVELPNLEMKPIYWIPVGDTAQVVRGTWFYQDTMLPVETHVANMLEAGYVDLQCWTETWKDELNSAVEVGALGEMKIVHKLWPEKLPT